MTRMALAPPFHFRLRAWVCACAGEEIRDSVLSSARGEKAMEVSTPTLATTSTPETPTAPERQSLVNKAQIRKALAALLENSKSRKNADDLLLNEKENLFLMVVLWKIPSKELRVRLSLPYSIRSDLAEVCLFTKDEPDLTPEKTEHFYRSLLNKHKINTISQIIPLRTLKKEYKPYEAKLRLLGSFDFFLTDARIRRLLPSIIGKHFYLRKKVPVSVNLLAKNLSKEINGSIGGTVLNISKTGSCSTIRIGHTGMKLQHILQNVVAVAKGLSEKLPEKWASVKLLYLKTEKSVALPIFSSFKSNWDDARGVSLPGQKKKEAKRKEKLKIKEKEKLELKREKKRRKREMREARKRKSQVLTKGQAPQVSGAPGKGPGSPKRGTPGPEKQEPSRVKAPLKVEDGSDEEIPLLIPMDRMPAKEIVEVQTCAIVKKTPENSPGSSTPLGKKRKASAALKTPGAAKQDTPGKGPGKKPRIKEETEKEINSSMGKKDLRQTPKKPEAKFFATPSKSAKKVPQTPKQWPLKPKMLSQTN
ncbi:ribosomal L1 domain-containing protein 1 isoform X2 [Choloepus didactylus]|uniref:ribosomal L1 domain-containing protein 1 isoform X2 n=1 Tax=Choloepus didactylus TaxID=27675 RepID=UPI00189DA196|nr:ribosomal L1 domain-containing protein 1 isoform X2 [Choloepus didactylus]